MALGMTPSGDPSAASSGATHVGTTSGTPEATSTPPRRRYWAWADLLRLLRHRRARVRTVRRTAPPGRDDRGPRDRRPHPPPHWSADRPPRSASRTVAASGGLNSHVRFPRLIRDARGGCPRAPAFRSRHRRAGGRWPRRVLTAEVSRRRRPGLARLTLSAPAPAGATRAEGVLSALACWRIERRTSETGHYVAYDQLPTLTSDQVRDTLERVRR
jgi:hypothetical protein